MNEKRSLDEVADHLGRMILDLEASTRPKRSFITILKKGEFQSNHSSFKQACEDMGWNYSEITKGGNARIPNIHDGYVIVKEEKRVTVPCQVLRRYITRKDITQSNDYLNWTHQAEFAPVVFRLGKYSMGVQVSKNRSICKIDFVFLNGTEIKIDLLTELLIKSKLEL